MVWEVLADHLQVSDVRVALRAIASAPGGELAPTKARNVSMCSAESSALMAVNFLAPFVSRGELLGLSDDALVFEREFRVEGVRARVGPTLDGVSAVPLARDPKGGRQGNVEADMLLLTEGRLGRKQLLVEVKTTANNAWYASIESLRQLKLFINSQAARQIFAGRQSHRGDQLMVETTVLAPPSFYSASGAKQRSVTPTLQLITKLADTLGVIVSLATWDPAARAIAGLA